MTRRVHRLISWMVCGSFAALSTGALAQESVDVAVTVRADQPGPVINPNIYGQFAEHLGAGIYEGVWVGEKSSIPNTNGYRNDVIAALKALKVPVVRWPGGCFADEYHWRDGIGPREKRPVKVNTHWGGVAETNEFGTHEFMAFAEMIGTKVYISGNVGSGSPQEMADWMEYMTSDTVSTLANERRKNGRDKPWDVHFFGIGNETWGCGGNMRPEYYADLFRQYATYVKAPRGKRPKIVASGGHDAGTTMGRGAHDHGPARHGRHLASLLHDSIRRLGKEGQLARLSRGRMDLDAGEHAEDRRIHHQQREGARQERSDRARWPSMSTSGAPGIRPEPGREPGFLYQQNSLRDALVAALNFHVFHAHAKRVQMANIAQMVNVLQAMILTDGPRMTLTPTYHAFEMYIPFQGATYLPTEIQAPSTHSSS